MKNVNYKLNNLSKKIESGAPLKIAIFGIGSVGGYVLDYLTSWPENNIELHVCARSMEKAEVEINIIRVGNIIRHNRIKYTIAHKVDLNEVEDIEKVLEEIKPDFIINCSRVYSGLKYGSISWRNIRAYGLWSPLSVKFIRNIMIAYEHVGCAGLVINTSYSDIVNPWLKSAGLSCPDFGSGNLNHLIPRIKMAAAKQAGIVDASAIDVVLATGHFHDVVISKEGLTEGMDPLVYVSCNGHTLDLDMEEIYRKCAIPMPVDARRNIMNASSNFEIISKIKHAISSRSNCVMHIPGVAGYVGGYPVRIDFREGTSPEGRISFVEDFFTLEKMKVHNRFSAYLDGIEDISNGTLTYTNELQENVKNRFSVDIPKKINFDELDQMAQFLVDRIIKPTLGILK